MSIKKYTNRRLYDNEIGLSRYVTIPDVRTRILNGESVYPHAKYNKTEEEVTIEVLLEIIRHDVDVDRGPTADDLRKFIKNYSMLL